MIHQLKTWPKYFRAIQLGEKTFEIRINDRDFKPGDILALQEFDPETQQYTGAQINRRVGYVLESTSEHNSIQGLKPGYIIMSLLEREMNDKGVLLW